MEENASVPDHTAVRVALWRALHVQFDSPPHVLDDELGLRLIAPDENWRQRPDMNPHWTSGYRASIVARSRFIEDLVVEQTASGFAQYVILGAGLDTFVQRRPEIASRLTVFEIDRPETQAWKHKRLLEIGLSVPQYLQFVPVDFESGDSWWENLLKHGFDTKKPAIVASTGVSMYLTREAIAAILRQIATLVPQAHLAMTFMLPVDLVEAKERDQYKIVMERASASGTPFLSLFDPSEILKLALDSGFKEAHHISTADLTHRYFSGRSDHLRPATGESILIATT